MKVVFNPRDNGACPICARIPGCSLRKALADSLSKFKDPDAQGLEAVIYSCPMFEEK